VRPILPRKGGSGFGNTPSSPVAAVAAGEKVVDATADAATREVEPSNKSRRLTPSFTAGGFTLVFLSEFLSLMVSFRDELRI
jgi:hypothetical protein